MRRPRGYALALALCFLSVVFVLGLAFGARTTSQQVHLRRTVATMQASYLAEGGAQHALHLLEGVQLPYQETLSFKTGTVAVSAVDLGEGRRRIVSRGTAGRSVTAVQLVVNGEGKVVDWREDVL